MLIQVLHSDLLFDKLQKFEGVWGSYSNMDPMNSDEFLNDRTVQKMFDDPPLLDYYVQKYPILMK